MSKHGYIYTSHVNHKGRVTPDVMISPTRFDTSRDTRLRCDLFGLLILS